MSSFQVIPLQAVPSQTINVVLNGQNCRINVFAKSTGVFFDLYVNDVAIVLARICNDRCPLVRYPYLNFVGDIFFKDMQGGDDPQASGLGGRFILCYWDIL